MFKEISRMEQRYDAVIGDTPQTTSCRCARGVRTPASSRADAGRPPAPPGFGECTEP